MLNDHVVSGVPVIARSVQEFSLSQQEENTARAKIAEIKIFFDMCYSL
jgi:hypothetical protein